MLQRIIAIKKLNNIKINCLRNLCSSVLSDKWRFNLIQDGQSLGLDFESFSKDAIANKTFQALELHIFTNKYLEKGFPRFTDVIDLELIAKPGMVNNSG